MARARCLECRAHVWWTASRGARLADVRCPACGGRLVGGKAAGPVPAVGSGRSCVVCKVQRDLGDPFLIELDIWEGACTTHAADEVEQAVRSRWGPWWPEGHRLSEDPEAVLARYRAALEALP